MKIPGYKIYTTSPQIKIQEGNNTWSIGMNQFIITMTTGSTKNLINLNYYCSIWIPYLVCYVSTYQVHTTLTSMFKRCSKASMRTKLVSGTGILLESFKQHRQLHDNFRSMTRM